MATIKTSMNAWVFAARPKTLIAILSPVLIGSALAYVEGDFNFFTFLVTLLAGLGVQISTNFCNDYFDFIKGADTSERKGPQRGLQKGVISLKQMKTGCILSFILTGLCCLYLIYKGGLLIAIFSVISLLLAYCYTGGPFSLAYLGISDLFCFLFFGPIASGLTYYLQASQLSGYSLLAGVAPGAISTAILAVNNIRDIDEDKQVNKKTLPVRLGKRAGEIEYIAMILIASLVPYVFLASYPLAASAALIIIPGIKTINALLKTNDPILYNRHLQSTAFLLFLYTALFCMGLLL